MSYFYLYLFTRLDCILNLIGIILVGSLFMFAFSYFFQELNTDDRDYNPVPYKKFRRYLLYVAIPSLVFTMFVPTQKQLAFIITAPMIYNNTDIQDTFKELPKAFNNLVQLGNQYLEENIKVKGE